jgi:hypothetical protein
LTIQSYIRRLLTGACCGPVLAVLVFVSAASAAAHHPTGEFAQFGECPLNRKGVNTCVYSQSTGGSVTIGKMTVPLKNPVTLQGGGEGSGSTVEVIGAESGETISKTPQPVPGGLVGAKAPSWWPGWLQDWFNNGIEEGLTSVTATIELAAPATSVKLSTENLLAGAGTAIGLPVKIRLENPLLGDDCHIGSAEEPLQIDFTSGASGDLKGTIGKRTINPEYTLATIRDGRLVAQDFAAPGASGCGGLLSFFLDPLVNSLLGLPAASGKNSAILEGKFDAGGATAVRESEG